MCACAAAGSRQHLVKQLQVVWEMARGGNARHLGLNACCTLGAVPPAAKIDNMAHGGLRVGAQLLVPQKERGHPSRFIGGPPPDPVLVEGEVPVGGALSPRA